MRIRCFITVCGLLLATGFAYGTSQDRDHPEFKGCYLIQGKSKEKFKEIRCVEIIRTMKPDGTSSCDGGIRLNKRVNGKYVTVPINKCEIAEFWINFETARDSGRFYTFEGGFLDESDVSEKYGKAQVTIEGDLTLFENNQILVKKEIGLEYYEGD